MLVKLLSLVLVAVAVSLFVKTLYERLTAWWNRRIDGYASWMTVEFQAMFEEMSLERARRIITVSTIGAFVIGFLFGVSLLQRVVLALLFAILAYWGPWALVASMRRRRLGTIDDQLVDALTMMANALKSGLNLQQALELVVREMKPPIADEFGRVVKEIHLGRLTDDALRRFAERLPLADVQLSIESILTLRETGGNLSETFQVIAHTIVERKKVEGKIKAMTAQGMTQGMVACMMPFAMMLIFSLIDPSFMRPFFTTPLGLAMFTLVLMLDALGLWLMFRLVRVDV